MESEALLAIVTVALKDPAAFGVNARLKVALCPVAIVVGKLGAVTEKLLLETVALLTVTDADPEFVTVTASVLVVPATTLPKSRLAFASDRLPSCGWLLLGGLPALRPWQAAKKESPNRSTNRRAVFHEFLALSWAGCGRAVEFGVIRGVMSHPPTDVVSGEDHQQCGPMLPNKTDFGGTCLLRAEGQRSRVTNSSLPNTTSASYVCPREGLKLVCAAAHQMEGLKS